MQKFVSSALNPHGESTQTLQAFATALSSYFKVSVTMQLHAMMITILIIIIIILIIIIIIIIIIIVIVIVIHSKSERSVLALKTGPFR